MEPATHRRESGWHWIVSVAFVVFGGPGVLGVYLPLAITHWHLLPEPVWLRSIALALMAFGLLPLFESIARFVRMGRGSLVPTVPTRFLVVSGFYCYVRNPMYIGVIALIAGQALLFASHDLALYMVIVAVGFHLFVSLYEEPKLRRTYGESYQEFCRHVPRWLPRTMPWHPSAG